MKDTKELVRQSELHNLRTVTHDELSDVSGGVQFPVQWGLRLDFREMEPPTVEGPTGCGPNYFPC